MAQTAGTMIHGVVQDEIETLMGCNVLEIDASNRIVAATTTDINGNFSFRIVDPKHNLEFSFVGYETQIIPIKGTSYKITLHDNGHTRRGAM
jgi:hypothetical protein